jgi:hypothetical protein
VFIDLDGGWAWASSATLLGKCGQPIFIIAIHSVHLFLDRGILAVADGKGGS